MSIIIFNFRKAFSLVEVVVALGLFAFCVVTIAGLLGVGLRSTRSVVNEGAASNIAESIYGAWQVQKNLAQDLTVEGLFTNLPDLGTSLSKELYFNANGQEVENGENEAAFKVTYETQVITPAPSISTQLYLKFEWPVNASSNAIQTRQYSRIFSR
jgi:uncharacterized protein (TIGR02598 family)